MLKITFVGQACAGKTTAAKMLCHQYNDGVIVKFADPIYRVLTILQQPKNRAAMQEFSVWAKKHFGRNIFINLFDRTTKFLECNRKPDCVTNDDCRFKVEFDYLKKRGWTTVYVEADETLRKERSAALGLEWCPDHESETEVPELKPLCDYVIENNGSLVDLEEAIRKLCK